MQADLGVANTPVRGLSYIVFYDLPLANYGNSLAGAQSAGARIMQLGMTYTYPYQLFNMPSGNVWQKGAMTARSTARPPIFRTSSQYPQTHLVAAIFSPG